MAPFLLFSSFWAIYGASQRVVRFLPRLALIKQPEGGIKSGWSPVLLAGVLRRPHPLNTSRFLRLVDGQKLPWWIVGSLSHQKKPRFLVSLVPHFKENFSLLRFEEELSGSLGTFSPLVPPAMPPGES